MSRFFCLFQESISSGASNNCRRGRRAAEGAGDGGSGDGAAGWGAAGSEDGEARVLMLGTRHTQYLRSDDATVRRVKRERMNRSLHRSLPSLPLGFSPEKVPDTRLPADGAEDDSESASCGRSQVFFDAFRFHEDQEEARRQAEEDECDDDENSPKLGAFPSSPHPLQRSRLVKRSPIKPRPEPEDDGIVDLRYTLNFSTPLLHGVTEADLPFSISTHVHHGPRVSFRDQDALHYYDAGRERRKSSLSSYSSPEVRRPRNTCSSTDIRLQIECSNVLQDEKLSPVVEYRVNDLDVLCPNSQKKVTTQDTEESVSPAEKEDEQGGSATDPCRPASNGALNRTPATGNNCLELRHGRSPQNNSRKTTAENSAMSSTARPAGHIFSTVIVHHVANVHI
ncbi:hypothetical protein E2C01_075200 [Portunus trituberculatus]|uniref:Uncharacterized protein n=1 Tax=Portunus trituberculatus TaxID=210409 RepID=A0A5B7IGG9_PORTR|nr:hypothetical protein [Portunus trituberculatus]